MSTTPFPSSKISRFLQEQQDHAKGTPAESLAAAVKRIEEQAYARGLADALIEFEMLGAIVPSSITKDWLVSHLQEKCALVVVKWEQKRGVR